MKKLISIFALIAFTSPVAAWDNYAGLRLHQNEHMTFKYKSDAGNHTMRGDSLGVGLYIGNRLTDNVKIEFETSFAGADFDHYNTNYDYTLWSNNINMYLFKTYDGAVEPYVGLGVGLTGIWGDAPAGSNSEFKLSYSLMTGVIFALNNRIDLNMGVKYHNYGKISHGHGATTTIDSIDLHIGAAYKFGLSY